MTKTEAIHIAKIELKKLGFKKIRQHWILLNDYYYIGFNIQGSQQNVNNYYVNFLIDNINKYKGKPLVYPTINYRFLGGEYDNNAQVNPSIIKAINKLNVLVETYFKVPVDKLVKNERFKSEFGLNEIQLNKLSQSTKDIEQNLILFITLVNNQCVSPTRHTLKVY